MKDQEVPEPLRYTYHTGQSKILVEYPLKYIYIKTIAKNRQKVSKI